MVCGRNHISISLFSSRYNHQLFSYYFSFSQSKFSRKLLTHLHNHYHKLDSIVWKLIKKNIFSGKKNRVMSFSIFTEKFNCAQKLFFEINIQ